MTLSRIVRPDGTCLEFFDSETEGDLLVYHHGTPGAGPLTDDLLGPARAIGLRVVELVRPGYGGSTRVPKRTVADVVPLAEELADHLGAQRYVTMGWSGGGPHALATAALSDRCAAAMTIAGVGMHGVPDLDFLDGMGEDNIVEFGAALQGEAVLRAFLEEAGEGLRDLTGPDVVAAMASLLPEADRAVLTDDYAESAAEVFRWAVSAGIDGWLDDDMAFVWDWGVDLASIRTPVTIWQGSADLMVPVAHGHWLARHVPGADVHILDGHGHMSIHEPAMLDGFRWLASHL